MDGTPIVLETISKGENSVTVAPTRGGIITSICLSGTEIMYLDQATFDDPAQNVRGGVPIMFPNSGVLEHESFPGMKNHGFARLSDQWRYQKSSDGATFNESLDTEPTEQFPYPSRLSMRAECTADAVKITQTATNPGSSLMPVAMGLHPYYKVAADKKQDIRFDFPGGEIIERDRKVWMEGGTVFIDNPVVADPAAVLRVTMPDVGTLEMKVSPEYRRIWVWSLPGKDFVCIEPAMRDPGALATDPYMVAPGDSVSAHLDISLNA